MRSRCLALLAAVALLPFAAADPGGADGADGWADAATLPWEASPWTDGWTHDLTTTLGPGDDADWYRFDFEAGELAHVWMWEGPGANLSGVDFVVVDDAGAEIHREPALKFGHAVASVQWKAVASGPLRIGLVADAPMQRSTAPVDLVVDRVEERDFAVLAVRAAPALVAAGERTVLVDVAVPAKSEGFTRQLVVSQGAFRTTGATGSVYATTELATFDVSGSAAAQVVTFEVTWDAVALGDPQLRAALSEGWYDGHRDNDAATAGLSPLPGADAVRLG